MKVFKWFMYIAIVGFVFALSPNIAQASPVEHGGRDRVRLIGSFAVPECGARVTVTNDPPSLHEGTTVEFRSTAGTVRLDNVESEPYQVSSSDLPNSWVGLSVEIWVIPGPDGRDSIKWDDISLDCPPPPPEPTCTVENFVLHAEVEPLSNTRAQIQAWVTWENGPNMAFIVWEFGGRTDEYGRGNDAITWDVDRLDEDYDLPVSAFILENDENCGTDHKTVTIEAKPMVPTPEPTDPPPTEVECNKEDFSVVIDGNTFTFFNSNGARCVMVAGAYNTHGFASLQVPGAFQTRIGYNAGWIEPFGTLTLTISEYDPAEECFAQLDAMVVSSMEEVDAVVPSKLTNENQGPQWNALLLAETHGDRICEDKPNGDPDKPVCPICPKNRVDENDHPATDVKIAKPVVLPCEVVWDEDKGEYCLTLDYPDGHVLRGWRQGPAFNLQLTGNEFWVTRTYTGADGLEYSSFRKVAPTGYKFIYWNGETPGEERLREDGTEVFEYWGPCSVTVGYHDTELIDGVAYGYWWEGHNVWEWKKFLTDEGYFDNWSDADAWAKELRLQGIGGRLKLPEKPTAASQLEEDDYSLSPDGSREAFLRNGNLWIRWTVERSDGFPQEWDTGVAAESVDSWDTNWVITITQDDESYQTDQFASFLNLVEFET